MELVNITINDLNFEVKLTNHLRSKLSDLLREFYNFKFKYDFNTKRYKMERDKLYAGCSTNAIRFNISYLPTFMYKLKLYGYSKNDVTIGKNSKTRNRTINVKLNPKFTLRDYQITNLKEICDNKELVTHLIPLMMGYGKTLVACAVMAKLNTASLLLLKAKYLKQWKVKLQENLNLEPSDIEIIQGFDSFNNLQERALNRDKLPKMILLSNTIFGNYIKEYENAKDKYEFRYNLEPDELLNVLRTPTLIVDEVHECFHTVFKASLYLNPRKFIGLSATFETKDNKIRNIHNILFPEESICSTPVYEKYITVFRCSYIFENKNKIHHINKQRMYSQSLFEQSIIKHTKILSNYLKMIDMIVKDFYIDLKKENDKGMIFAATQDMCTLITNYLKDKYKHLNIVRFIQGDDYESILDSDLFVTTIGKTGTGIDIDGLITVIQTVNTVSPVSNKQTIGRLRKIKDKEVRFVYLFANNIDKHREYDKERISTLSTIYNRLFSKNITEFTI